VEGLIENKEIRIYPNPVEDYCYVELGFDLEQGEEAELSLYDYSGRKMHTIQTSNRITKMTTGILPQGVYIVTAKTKNKSVNAKIIKK
ncbi:T9SS type A sorting domain-containing protein, partial [Weeksellaceae bacterium A-14]